MKRPILSALALAFGLLLVALIWAPSPSEDGLGQDQHVDQSGLREPSRIAEATRAPLAYEDGRREEAPTQDSAQAQADREEAEPLQSLLDRSFGHFLSPETLADPSFAFGRDSPLGALKSVIRRERVSVEAVRSALAESELGENIYTWLLLSLPYSEGASGEDGAWLRQQVLGGGSDSSAELAAVHACNLLDRELGEEHPLLGLTTDLVDRGLNVADLGVEDQRTLGLTLELIGPGWDGQLESKLAELASDPVRPANLRASAWIALAKQGGEQAARLVVDRALDGDTSAKTALALLRNQRSAPDLRSICERALAGDSNAIELAPHALLGLLGASFDEGWPLFDQYVTLSLGGNGPDADLNTAEALFGEMGGAADRLTMSHWKGTFHHLKSKSAEKTYSLPPVASNALDQLVGASMTHRWYRLTTHEVLERRKDLRSVIESLPAGSRRGQAALYDLAVIANASDRALIYARMDPKSDLAPGILSVLE